MYNFQLPFELYVNVLYGKVEKIRFLTEIRQTNTGFRKSLENK